ncbi:uncharacterized protein LOC124922415 [Impatiens glandulifera]|uniref:uncharacterized protein LOC124922415 n=1 Tax=Impatiens glandulifera TaxID=253017 RepID=UPI001FB0B632|nr:uncharacterized protein LOC124922415 [Impatiens glandulifera]
MEKSKSLGGYASCQYADMRLGLEDRANSYSFNGPNDNPEVKRRKRVASYNMYSVERKLKSSLSNSFKWIKGKLSHNFYES